MSDTIRRLAAIDIGTVTTRLLVADVGEASIVEVARSTDITHLGENLTRTGRLAPEAMVRVSSVIGRYAATIGMLGVEATVAIATSASRDAANSEEFLEMLAAHGIYPEVIPGTREAFLSFAGATFGLDADRVLVDDIGGGSTELVFGRCGSGCREQGRTIELARSIDVGSRRLTEVCLHSDPPAPSEIEAARALAATELRPYFDMLGERPELLVSVAGTATSLAAVRLGLAEYDPAIVHGHTLTGHDVADLIEMLAAMPLRARREVVGLHPDRAPVIVAGALILEAVMALAGTDSTMVSERDILYGILLDAGDGESGS
jgi:exopolyphosphatase/guanosine-5'-triphosphate,3'-diphosphate pyrophosphatase